MVRLRGGYGEGIFNLDTEKSTFKRLDDPKVTPRKNEPKTCVKRKTTVRLQRGENQPQARIIFARHYARVRDEPGRRQLLIRFVRLIEQFNAFVWCFYGMLCELLEQ